MRTALRLARRGGVVFAALGSAAWGSSSAAPADHPPVPAPVSAAAAVAAPPRCLSPSEAMARWPRLTVLPDNLLSVRALFTTLRNKDTPHGAFAFAADRLMRILAEEGFAALGTTPLTVTTPCGSFDGLVLADSNMIAAVSIVRAGDALLEAARAVQPALSCGKILIQRDESDPLKRPRLFYVKLPPDVASRSVLLVDPMCATAQSVCMAIEELLRHGVREDAIVFLNVVACPPGLDTLFARFPRVRVVTAAVDAGLNEHKYIVPGLGDYGDRYFGTTVR